MENKGNWRKLKVGNKIKIGEKFAEDRSFKSGEIIELVQGYFEIENGLYATTETAPAIKSVEYDGEYDSIFHLFGNDLEDFMDCELF